MNNEFIKEMHRKVIENTTEINKKPDMQTFQRLIGFNQGLIYAVKYFLKLKKETKAYKKV